MADLLHHGGTINHLLWTLLFLKTYSNQKILCSLAGGVNATTFEDFHHIDGFLGTISVSRILHWMATMLVQDELSNTFNYYSDYLGQ